MGAWVQTCPGCLRRARDLEAPEPTAKSVVASEGYRRQLEDPQHSPLANEFLCRAMLDEAEGAPNAAAQSPLNAAWACDDDRNDEAARRCRGRAAGTSWARRPRVERSRPRSASWPRWPPT